MPQLIGAIIVIGLIYYVITQIIIPFVLYVFNNIIIPFVVNSAIVAISALALVVIVGLLIGFCHAIVNYFRAFRKNVRPETVYP